MVLNTPLPAAINKPVGPFILSVHPGTGSFQIGITGIKIIFRTPRFVFALPTYQRMGVQ